MKTISAANKAWLEDYCKGRAQAAADFNAEDLAKVFEAFFYLGQLCRASGKHSLATEFKSVIYGRDVEALLGRGAQP